jgi:hypothetical protein
LRTRFAGQFTGDFDAMLDATAHSPCRALQSHAVL